MVVSPRYELRIGWNQVRKLKCIIRVSAEESITEREGQGQNCKRLVGEPRGRGTLTVIDCLRLGFAYNSKTARIQQKSSRILKRRYASHSLVERPAMNTRGGMLSQRTTCVIPSTAS